LSVDSASMAEIEKYCGARNSRENTAEKCMMRVQVHDVLPRFFKASWTDIRNTTVKKSNAGSETRHNHNQMFLKFKVRIDVTDFAHFDLVETVCRKNFAEFFFQKDLANFSSNYSVVCES
jgi:hypothetical protein